MKNRISAQRGFLSLVAVVLIVIISFIGLTITYMFVASAEATNAFAQSEKAFFIAESGLEKTKRFLTTPTLSGANARIACGSITGNANLTNSSFSVGTFTVTSSGSTFAATTLSSAVNSTVTTIPVASTSGFASSGAIQIDRELIFYAGISGNSFINVTRGANGSRATPHASGAGVVQFQCVFNSKGGVPNVTSSLFARTVQEGLGPLQEAWTVGNATGTSFVLSHWNRPTALQWTNASFTNANHVNLLGVSLISNVDGWAVGNSNGTTLTMLHLTTSGWVTVLTGGACNNQVINSVSSVYSNEAWAVGNRSTCHSARRRYEIVRWNGSTWTELAPPTIPADNNNNQNLMDVHVIDTTGAGSGNVGFAVGLSGRILRYNGSTWTAVTSPTTQNLNGVFVVSASEAWAVGNNGTIIKWNGTSWSTFASPTGTQLNSIYMLDTDDDGLAEAGWAVGNNGTAVTYNGTSWSSQSAGDGNLNGVAMFDTQDVWAVGNNGRITHWDGTAWTNFTSGVTTNLNHISLVPQRRPFSFMWQEIFP